MYVCLTNPFNHLQDLIYTYNYVYLSSQLKEWERLYENIGLNSKISIDSLNQRVSKFLSGVLGDESS